MGEVLVSEAPWWATGVFTLAGAGITQLAALALNRSRGKYEDSRRWHEDRRDIYLEVVTSGWEIEQKIFNHFELSLPASEIELFKLKLALEAAYRKVQLVGSEEVAKISQDLTIKISAAVAHVGHDDSGKALDSCDSIRATLYYLTDAMRSELTGNKAAISAWYRKTGNWRRRNFSRKHSMRVFRPWT